MAFKQGTLVKLESELGFRDFEADTAERLLQMQVAKGKRNWWLPDNSKFVFEDGSIIKRAAKGKSISAQG